MKISFVIPTFQEEKRLEPTLRNIKQNMTIPHEIIISDGESTDKTLEIARRYTNKIVVYSGEGRQKPSVGRNDGAKLATGEFIVFLDSGSFIPEPDAFFEKAFKSFENRDMLAVTCWMKVFKEKETLSDKFFLNFLNSMHFVANNVIKVGSSAGRFLMIRRDAFEKVGGYSNGLTFNEDNDLFQRITRIGRTSLDRDLIVYHSESRAHALGWPKLISLWVLNIFWQKVFGRPFSKKWEPVR